MKTVKIAAIFSLCLLLTSCEGDEIFKKELYEKIVYVLTTEDNQVFPEAHSLDNEVSTGYVSVLVSGSTPITAPINVEFEFDNEAIDRYNEKIYGVNEELYLDPLDPSLYDIPSMKITIDQSDLPARGLLPIKIKMEGLSPDEIYFIPLKIKSVSSDSISEKNNSVLYRVYIRNQYADQKDQTQYSMRGEKTEEGEGKAPYLIMTNKLVLPLTKNKIRTTVDQAKFEPKPEVINSSCMVIEIKSDNSLAITPYNANNMELEMVEKEGFNQYRKDVVGSYRIYLSYRYRIRTSPEAEWGAWSTISENLLRYDNK